MSGGLISIGAICIDSGDSRVLASFYAKLLGWEVFYESDDGAAIRSPEKTQILGFQTVDDYTPPVWPWEEGKQGQMMHLDLTAENVASGLPLPGNAAPSSRRRSFTATTPQQCSTRPGTPSASARR